MKKINVFYKGFIFTVRKSIMSSPIYFLILIISSLCMAISFVLQTQSEKLFFESASEFGNTINNNLIFYFIAFILTYILTQIFIHISNCTEELLEFRLQNLFSKLLGEKVSKIEPIMFEDSKFLDLIDKVQKGKESMVYVTLCSISLLFYYIPYFIIMSIWLFNLNYVLVLAIPISFIPTILTYIVQIKSYFIMEDTTSILRRRLESYENSILGKSQIKETRILGCTSFFLSLYKEVLKLIHNKEMIIFNKRQRLNLILKVIQALSFVSILLMALRFVINGSISVGSFAAIFSSIDILYSNVDEAISRQFGTITERLGSVKYFIDFYNSKYEDNEIEHLGFCKRLSNVSFSYPNSKEPSLKNISLEIYPGEILAIVGENGSGKSTLVKLLLGLYKPNKGTIEYFKDHQEGKTAVFQNHINYAMTLAENITISSEEPNDECLNNAIKDSGLVLSSEIFVNGTNTFLAKEFGGIDLSGGEWQKVAIGRGIYKNFEFIALDEPTSSIDPLEESKIYENIKNITKQKTAIIVTHRMASVKFADKIAVMKSGNIIEYGDHQSLIAFDGEYKRLYSSQSKDYVNYQ